MRPPLLSTAKRQRGVSLIELMISMTIGLIIMIAVISAYLGASGASRTAEAIGRMNEDGQAALTILTQQLRMAGVNPSQPDRWSVSFATPSARGNTVPLHNSVTNAFAIRGCDTKFSDVTTAASTAALTCGHVAASVGPDSISIGYEADRYNTIALASGQPTDCMGVGIDPLSPAPSYLNGAGSPVNASIYEAENRFYIGTSTYVTNPTLYCRGNGNGSTAQPLVENIENLQFSFGTVNPNTTTSPIYVTVNPTFTTTLVLGYMSAYELENYSGANPAMGATGATTKRWNAVKAIRICVVARSEQPLADSLDSARYVDCNGTLTVPPDKRLRRAYTTTVVLRNQ